MKFKALIVEKGKEKQFVREIRERSIDDLPPGNLVVRVRYNSMLLSGLLERCLATGHEKALDLLRRISPAAWQHWGTTHFATRGTQLTCRPFWQG